MALLNDVSLKIGNATFTLKTIQYFQIRHPYSYILMVLIVCGWIMYL